MPLKRGYSRPTFEANYHMMRKEGKAHNVALAAAYNAARESYFKAYPHGALPAWLAYPDGRRMKPVECCTGKRRKNPVPVLREDEKVVTVKDIYGRSHRVRESDLRSEIDRIPTIRKNGEIWSGEEIPRSILRRKNPVPESSRSAKHSREARIQAAADLYTRFTGHDADELVSVDKPEVPDVMLTVGDVDGILYTTVRDGVVEKYIHKFKKDCRPLFCVSHDGKQLFMLGGSYDFTERGIVDRS